MGLFQPPSPIQEVVFRKYTSNVLLAINGQDPFRGERGRQQLNNFYARIDKILENRRFILRARSSKYVYLCPPCYTALDEKDELLNQFCDEILEILFNRRKDLKNLKINGNHDYCLFIDNFFDFLLSDSNLPHFVNLIFKLVNGGTIFSKEGDYEKASEWLDSFEFKI